MGWFILVHVFTTWMSIVSIGRLSKQEKELEIWVLRQQLAILQRKCHKPVKPNRAAKLTLAILAAKLNKLPNDQQINCKISSAYCNPKQSYAGIKNW